ncbi:hypothetical protein H9P43_008777 [Blastocladiella emersonii ATCC 22665]|nr:hypothetical protein H9P43_008777 [Blastocladiella emersonii ATCC 22665]
MLLPGIPRTSAIRIQRTDGSAVAFIWALRHVYNEASRTVDVTWYIQERPGVLPSGVRYSIWALPALEPNIGAAEWIRISNELPYGGNGGGGSADVAVPTRVPAEAMQGAVRGIMASAAAAAADRDASRAAARPPPMRLTILDVIDITDGTMSIHFELPRGRGKASVSPVPASDLAQYRGAIAVLIDGKAHTFQLPWPGHAVTVYVDAKTRRVTVKAIKSSHAVAPALGLCPLIPRFASFPVPEHGRPVSAFMNEAALRMLDRMYSRDELPSAFSKRSGAPSQGRSGEWRATRLKVLVAKLFDFADKRGGPCVLKVSGSGSRGAVALIFAHRPVVIPPQGKAFGLTPALDVSYVYVPPLPPKSAPAAARASGQKLRKLIEKTENAYVRASEARIPTVDGLGEIGDAIGEYLESCRAATVDREIPDINRFPQTKPGSQKVAPAVATAFASLKGELKRALLLPLFPTCFDNCPQHNEYDYECDDEYCDSEDDY